ncbi:MAG: hypothetical protein R2873_06840 [Caldilineaceae bacterium]
MRNAGPSDAAGVTVADVLPAGRAGHVRSSQGGCGSLPCTLGTIPAGGSATVTLIGDVDAAVQDELSNTASVTAQTALISTENDSTIINTGVSPLADLFVRKRGAATVNAGEAIDYRSPW